MYEKLKAVMKDKGISNNQLSFMSHIAASDLSSALGGKKPLYNGWKKRISAALGVDETILFEEE